MKLPRAELGLVFRYDYLWLRESAGGRLAGKERPACIVVATDPENAPQLVVILPITHSRPSPPTSGVAIPPATRRMLGLDDEPCWVVVSEHNVDDWPNSGVAPLPGRRKSFAYGFLPPALFNAVRSEFLRLYDKRRSVRR